MKITIIETEEKEELGFEPSLADDLHKIFGLSPLFEDLIDVELCED